MVTRTAKHHLPNYGVFDEYRYFVRGDRLPIFRLHGVDVAIAVCEDLWQEGGPVSVVGQAGAGLLVVPNASPYEKEKDDVRLELCARRAHEAGCALVYVNQVSGQDELVFDGDSLVVDASGELVARAAQFREELLVADLDLPVSTAATGTFPYDAGDGSTITVERLVLSQDPVAPYPPEPARVAEPLSTQAEVYAALVLAVRDYVAKNGFRSVILGLSGGIDSALTATIAADAIGPSRVHVVLMPSRYSSAHSLADAEELVRRQGLTSQVVPIADIVTAFEKEVGLSGLAAENLQARVRGMILMGLSNEHGHLVLTTGNKSELATGYSTLYGDSAGGFAPIKDVPKIMVWELSRWRNAHTDPMFLLGRRGRSRRIPSPRSRARAAPRPARHRLAAALRGAGPVLDDYVEKDMGSREPSPPGTILSGDAGDRPGGPGRVQAPAVSAGPKITPKNFGRDRRLPITNRWRETAP